MSPRLSSDRQATAQLTCNPPAVVAGLVQTVLRAADTSHHGLLLDEVRCLLCHPAAQVREVVVQLLLARGRPLSEVLLSFVKDRLLVAAGLRLSGVDEEKDGQRGRPACTWLEKGWRGPGGQLLHGAMYVPLSKCLQSGTARHCLQHAAPRERSMQHVQHLGALRQLGPHPNRLSLLAFQAQPLPLFYLTENVSDRRLLYLLIDDRTASCKLPPAVLLSAALQVVKALLFLDSKRFVLRDVTTHNMIYILEKDEDGVTTSISVKLADLGLTHQYKDGDRIRPRKYIRIRMRELDNFSCPHPMHGTLGLLSPGKASSHCTALPSFV